MSKFSSIIYHPKLAPRFSEYGIPVPLDMNRSDLAWRELSKNFSSLKQTSLNVLPALSWQDVTRAHDLDFVARLLDEKLSVAEISNCYELKSYGHEQGKKPLSEMPHDVLFQCRGTLHAAQIALKSQWSFFLGGGMHHAMRFAGRGFCLLNDVVIAARKLQQEQHLGNVLVIDVDAHKGDGTAQITNGDSSITTLSLHMANGWPIDGSLGVGPWDIPSDIDVAIDVNQEGQYLKLLEQALDKALTNTFDLVFIVLGSDVWEEDCLPSSAGIKLSAAQVLERDQLIESKLREKSLPRTYVMGGGYGPNAHKPYVDFISTLLS